MTNGISLTLLLLPVPLCDGWCIVSLWNCTCLSLGELSRELDREDRRIVLLLVVVDEDGAGPASGSVVMLEVVAVGGGPMMFE